MGEEDHVSKEGEEKCRESQLFTLWTHRPLKGCLPLKVQLQDVTAQEDDRVLIDSLLEHSEEGEEGLIGTLMCGDWRDAVTGWSLTRPNVKYAWVEKSGKDRKNRNAAKKRKQEHSWKNKIEPDTYKYNPGGGMQDQPLDILEKRQVHPSLQQHIDKVREHLEKTLMKQPSNGGLEARKPLAPLPSIDVKHNGSGDAYASTSITNLNEHNHGQYVVKMTQRSRRHSVEDDDIHYHSDGGGDSDKHFHRNGAGRQSDTKLLNMRSRKHTKHKQYQHDNSNNAIDLVTALGQKLNEILMEDRLKSLSGVTSLPVSRKIQKSSLFSSATNSYERFPTTEIVSSYNEQPLNPLTKVTPHQRQIHDDNEAVTIESSRQEKANTSSAGSHATQYSSDISGEQSSTNKDFIHIGISGQRVPSSSERKRTKHHDSASPVNLDKKNRGAGFNKFHKLPLTHGKKSESSSEKTGDDLHRGVIDREAAAAVAVALMPGVSGRKIEVPNA